MKKKKVLKLDDLDRKILSELSRDGRVLYKEIAKKTEVSEGAIRNRIKRMKESGYLRIVGVVDPLFFECNSHFHKKTCLKALIVQ